MRARGYELYSAQTALDDGHFFLATMGAIDQTDIERFLAVFAESIASLQNAGSS